MFDRSNTTAREVPGEGAGISELKAFLLDLIRDGRGEDAVEMVLDLVLRLRDDNNAKALRIAKLLRERFGRKGERVTREQLDLFLRSVEEADRAGLPDDVETPPLPEAPKKKKRRRKRTGRDPLPENLPRHIHVLEPPLSERTCSTCLTEKTCIGHETSEVLEFVPAQFEVHEYRRQKLACRKCEDGVVIAWSADKPIERGRPGPGLLAEVVVSKYVEHQPLYRTSKRFARLGVPIADSTLMNWVAATAFMLKPIHDELRRLVLGSHVLGVDDTHIKVLDRKAEGNVKRGHIWPYVGYEGGRRIRVAFHYTPDWKGSGPRGFLEKRVGYVQGDGYAGIDELFDRPDSTAIRVGCWAHGRRKVKEALDGGDLRAAVPLTFIQRLYEIERRATELALDPEGRRQFREEHAGPVLQKLKAWTAEIHAKLRPTSPLAKAVGYLVNQWSTLEVYVQDGAIPIDNNGVENLIRPVALGRKNWLFAGSDEGAERAAVLMSVVGSCQLAAVEPWAYLRDVIEKLSSGWPASRIEELLPERWRAPEPDVAPDSAPR